MSDELAASAARVQRAIEECGLALQVVQLPDRDLFTLQQIWAAAGTPHAVFRLTRNDLQALTSGKIAQIK